MPEYLVIPPSIINNTIVGLSKDRMCTVYWDTNNKSFRSAEDIYTVAEVADAPLASKHQIERLGVTYRINT
tara:strand:- start:82 stop:294 length:213 start_codon:yes stop_codon:yes gene_type:complete